MKFIAKKTIDVVLRCPRLFLFKGETFLIGSEKINSSDDNTILQYWSCIYKLDNNFDILPDFKYKINIPLPFVNIEDTSISCWTRDVNVKNDKVFFNVELKKNIGNQSFKHDNYLFCTDNFIDYVNAKSYTDFDNYFLFKDITINEKELLFLSYMSADEEFPNFCWGKYLFEIRINNEIIRPQFDNCVNYSLDKGHVLHGLLNLDNNEYLFFFTIRHLINNAPEFIYKMYSAKTKDFTNFYETKEVSCINDVNDAQWYSYPSLFLQDNNFYAVTNQDEFGKNKKIMLFAVEL
jgi:hypothetical protein